MTVTREEWEQVEYRQRVLTHLRSELRLTSLPAVEQLSAIPDACDKPYELVGNVCNWASCVLSRANEFSLSVEQSDALESLVDLADIMSGAENSALWTEGAVTKSPEWARLRRRSEKALHSFGWCESVESDLESPNKT